MSQCSVGGGLISAANLDDSINDYFKYSENEISYSDLRMQPMIYQDDLARIAISRESAQAGNDLIETCLETKLLDLHADKSCYILTGNQEKVKLLRKEIDQNAITLYGEQLKEKNCEKYLGDMIHSDGNAASVAETVKTRSGKVASYIFEARAIIDDTRINTVGGLKAGLDIWEMAYLPSLLNNCQTWVEIEDATIDKLEEIQNQMYRTLLSTPKSTPWPALVWDLGGIKMKFRKEIKLI